MNKSCFKSDSLRWFKAATENLECRKVHDQQGILVVPVHVQLADNKVAPVCVIVDSAIIWFKFGAILDQAFNTKFRSNTSTKAHKQTFISIIPRFQTNQVNIMETAGIWRFYFLKKSWSCFRFFAFARYCIQLRWLGDQVEFQTLNWYKIFRKMAPFAHK